MKKFIKDWWPLLLIAVWWLWKKTKRKPATPKGEGYRRHIDERGNLTEWWYDDKGLYHLHTHYANGVDLERTEGDPCEKVCYKCGSPQTYQKRYQPSPAPGIAPYILREVCSNPDCPTHMMVY